MNYLVIYDGVKTRKEKVEEGKEMSAVTMAIIARRHAKKTKYCSVSLYKMQKVGGKEMYRRSCEVKVDYT